MERLDFRQDGQFKLPTLWVVECGVYGAHVLKIPVGVTGVAFTLLALFRNSVLSALIWGCKSPSRCFNVSLIRIRLNLLESKIQFGSLLRCGLAWIIQMNDLIFNSTH